MLDLQYLRQSVVDRYGTSELTFKQQLLGLSFAMRQLARHYIRNPDRAPRQGDSRVYREMAYVVGCREALAEEFLGIAERCVGAVPYTQPGWSLAVKLGDIKMEDIPLISA